MKKIIVSAIVGILLLGSCTKEELPIPGHKPGDVVIGQVEMSSDYRYQLFYDLGTNSIVGKNLKTTWDLGFENGSEGWHIILNTSKGGGIAKTETSDFASVKSEENAQWSWDNVNGDLDSTAIGDYRNTNQVYLLDGGFDYEGKHTGYWKFKVNDVDEEHYIVQFDKINGTNPQTVEIIKEEEQNFVAFSFKNKKIMPVEPPKEDWDIQFTQYTHVFHLDPPVPYIVTGVLSNRNGVQVAVDKTKTFEEITIDNVEEFDFVDDIDKIGYDWKEFNFSAGNYTIYSEVNYLVKDTEGRYFKLHFVDFYSESGEKGAPKFEVQEL